MITDSKVCIGVILKGRSRSPALNLVARRLAAYILGCQLTVYVRWIPSQRNHADGPSRGYPPGQAPKEQLPRVRPPGTQGVWIDGVLVEARPGGREEAARG